MDSVTRQATERFNAWLETEKANGLIDLKLCAGQQRPDGINSILDSVIDMAEAHDQGKPWTEEIDAAIFEKSTVTA